MVRAWADRLCYILLEECGLVGLYDTIGGSR